MVTSEKQKAANRKSHAVHKDERNRKQGEYRVLHREEKVAYDAEYRVENKEKIRVSDHARYATNREYHAAHRIRYTAQWVNVLPPKCVDCGETKICLLELDHKNGGGRQHRIAAKYSNSKQWLVAHPEEAHLFEVRCIMCHAIKTANEKIDRIGECA